MVFAKIATIPLTVQVFAIESASRIIDVVDHKILGLLAKNC